MTPHEGIAVAIAIGVLLGLVVAYGLGRANAALNRASDAKVAERQRNRAVANETRWRREQSGAPR